MHNPNPSETERELKVTTLGVSGLDFAFRNNSAARRAMNATQIGQTLTVEGGEPRRIFTGMEAKYGQETFRTAFPCNATVIETVNRYQQGVGFGAIRENPETTVIYEEYDDPYKTVNVLHLKRYESLHTEFGFPMRLNSENIERLRPGADFGKDEVLADSIAVGKDGSYAMGVEAQVSFFAHPGTIEDGFVVREGFLKKLTAHRYQTVIGGFGKNHFPLNLFGDANNYKSFPDIGDVIGDDGVVMALREVDPVLGVADMTPRALREIDHSFDRVLYARPGARIIDIKVYFDERLNPSFTPEAMTEQPKKYYDAQSQYYRKLLDIYERLKRQRKKALKISPEFNRLLVEALMYLPTPVRDRKLTRMYKLETLDEWRVEITFDWPMPVHQGFKATDMHGTRRL